MRCGIVRARGRRPFREVTLPSEYIVVGDVDWTTAVYESYTYCSSSARLLQICAQACGKLDQSIFKVRRI